MKKTFSCLWLLATMLTALNAYAQLPAFTLNVTGIPQTCLGNGSLNFTVNGNNPEASMEFAVFLLPNTTTPVTTVTNPVASGLVSGNYLVVATQTLNNTSNTASGNATIADNTVPLVYSATAALCGSTGTITINVTSGTAVGYEIIAGPVVVPQQSSNVFIGLPAGQYQVRVYDDCGDGLVTTVQVQAVATDVVLYNQLFPTPELASCNTIAVSHDYATSSQILWPLTLTFIIHPPGGAPDVVVTQEVASGNQFGTINSVLPFYNGQTYNYEIFVADACDNEYMFADFIISKAFDFSFSPGSNICNNFFLAFELQNYSLPCTVSFLEAPAGFDPALFNASHPTQSSGSFIYGSDDNPVPLGDYTVKITDACGRTSTKSVELTGDYVPMAEAEISPANCLGIVKIKVQFGRDMVSVTLNSAPEAYPETLPQDVSSFISGDTFVMDGFPVGTYIFTVVDECNNSWNVTIEIHLPQVNPNIFTTVAPGCNENEGSVGLFIFNAEFNSVIITDAPLAFDQSLPFDASDNIGETNFWMNSLPEGSYAFETTDKCGNVRTAEIEITGYKVLANNTEIIYNCGSFDVNLQFHDNNGGVQSFWLQKYNEVTSTWEHPATGVPYNGIVNTNNSILLTNSQLNVNNAFTGQFRILQTFSVYPNGDNYTNSSCIHEVINFTYTGQPEIIGAYAFPCTDGLAEVILDAVGTAPLEYAITSKDGMPFTIDNGQSNVFLSLPEATYNFQVTDACNNVINIIYDITALSPLEITSDGFCNGEDSSFWVPQYSFLTYEWWEESQPNVILNTTNTLNFPDFNAADDGGTYMVRIVSTTPGSCIDLVLDKNTAPAVLPNAGADVTIALCRIGEINLSNYITGASQQDGTWQEFIVTGALNGSMLDTDLLEPGTYHITYTVSFCDFVDEATITIQLAGNNSFDLQVQAGCESDAFIISLANLEALGNVQSIEWTGPGNFSYSGPEADITGLKEGTYTVTVINEEGCSAAANIPVATTSCMIPKGVSPNGDGLNDSFDLSNLDVKQLNIFNRYGLQVYEKAMYINEWYGQSDKGELTTGTYYYVIMLASGRQVTGWVYLQKGSQ